MSNNSVLNVIHYSKHLGEKDTRNIRTQGYVHRKLSEEIGELSVEIQVQEGTTYKPAGKDGVQGEAVDIAICAIDSFALEHPGKTAEEILELFYKTMQIKLQKWADVQQ